MDISIDSKLNGRTRECRTVQKRSVGRRWRHKMGLEHPFMHHRHETKRMPTRNDNKPNIHQHIILQSRHRAASASSTSGNAVPTPTITLYHISSHSECIADVCNGEGR
jgi:hypothetical protein